MKPFGEKIVKKDLCIGRLATQCRSIGTNINGGYVESIDLKMAISSNEHAQWRHYKPAEVKIINDRPVQFRDIKVYEFKMSDVEDPDLFAAKPLYEWSQSECGKWCISHAEETPYWVREIDPMTYGYRYFVVARLSEQNETYFTLKWKNK